MTSQFTIKACLNNYLLQPFLHPTIVSWVNYISKLYVRGSLFFNIHLLRLLENHLPLPSFQKEKDLTFFERCLKIGIWSNRSKFPDHELESTYNLYQKYFPPLPRLKGDNQAIQYFAGKLQTSFVNHIKYNFFQRQLNVLRLLISDRKKLKLLQKMVNNLIPIDLTKFGNLSDEDKEKLSIQINLHKSFLQNNDPNQIINLKWIDRNFNRAIEYTYYLQVELSNNHAKNFSIAPIATVKSHFLVIDTKILYHLLKDAKLIKNVTKEEFRADRDFYWSQCFNYQKLSKKPFAYYIETDGVALCVHFEKSIKKSTPLLINLPLKDQRVIAFDPGRETILHGVEKLPNGEIKEYKLSRGQYYEESHINLANHKTKKWNAKIQDILDELSATTYRTPKIQELLKYIVVYNKHYERYWDQLADRKYAMNRMDVYIHRNQCMDQFFQSLQEKDQLEPIIAYGAAKFNSTGIGEQAVPTTFIGKRCQEYYKMVMIDEYKTSQICHQCEEKLTLLYRDEKGQIKHFGREIRGLRWCGSTKCRKLINRDRNAALNILKIVTEGRKTNLTRKQPDNKKEDNR